MSLEGAAHTKDAKDCACRQVIGASVEGKAAFKVTFILSSKSLT